MMTRNAFTIAGTVSGTIIGIGFGITVGVFTLGLAMPVVPIFATAGSILGGVIGNQLGRVSEQRQAQRNQYAQQTEHKIQHFITTYDLLKHASTIHQSSSHPKKQYKIREALVNTLSSPAERELANLAITQHKAATLRTKKKTRCRRVRSCICIC
ncbi:MAG: hypothetical protein Tsb005_14110 [Gammaproteobacteria bacterium]